MLISEFAKAERIGRGYIGMVLRLTLLAPGLVEAIVDGQGSGPPVMGGVPEVWGAARG